MATHAQKRSTGATIRAMNLPASRASCVRRRMHKVDPKQKLELLLNAKGNTYFPPVLDTLRHITSQTRASAILVGWTDVCMVAKIDIRVCMYELTDWWMCGLTNGWLEEGVDGYRQDGIIHWLDYTCKNINFSSCQSAIEFIYVNNIMLHPVA